jgi:uncharacterized protein DUF3352
MTDPYNPATPPDGATPPPSAPAAGDTPMPAFEPAEPGTATPAQVVARDGASEAATGTGSRRTSGLRWAIALLGVALVVGATAAIIALAAGRPSVSIAVGYMPDGVVQYGEYRFDLPGNQRQELASFLSAFPGFADQAAIDTKLDETFDRIIGAISDGKQTWTQDIEPWFGGVVGFGSLPPTPGDGSAMSAFGARASDSLFVVSIKDRDLATAWIEDLTAEYAELSQSDYNGADLYTGASDVGPGYAIAVNDEVLLLGTEDVVRDAVDSQGDGNLARDPEFQAAFATASDDYVLFQFSDTKALMDSYVDLMAGTGGDETTRAVFDELVSLVPAWQGMVGRFQNDALEAEIAAPSVDLGFESANRRSTLLGFAPPSTIAYYEVHDVGKAVTALLERFRDQPAVEEGISELEATIGQKVTDIVGWWGDASVALAKDQEGRLGGGLLIAPTDAAAAERLFTTLRSFAVLGGAQAGIEVRDVAHGDATITVVDFSGALGDDAAALPDGYKAEIAYTVTDDVVVLGIGQAFVESVLDAGRGPSLADDGRVSSLLDRVGNENIGFGFLDVRAIRETFEPLIRGEITPERWTYYETEIQPFLLPFDAAAGSFRHDGDLDRGSSVITVTKP